jgi:hypothetical protein
MKIYITKNSNNKEFFEYHEDIEIIKKPIIYFKGKTLYKNFDVVYTMDGTDLDHYDNSLIDICKIHNIPVLGRNRFNKSVQYLILNKYDIYTPYTVFNNVGFKQDINANIALLNEINDDEQIVVKMLSGARGWGQLTGKKIDVLKCFNDEYFNLLEHSTDEVKYVSENEIIGEQQKEKTNELLEYYRNNLKWNNIGYLDFNSCIIQRFIPNIKNEYRLLLFYNGEYVLVLRDKTENNWQANACNNDLGSSKVISKGSLKHSSEINIIMDKMRKIMNEYDFTHLSVDIFEDEDNNFGVFEFQQEFGWTNTVNIDSVLLCKNITESLIKKINDYGTK